MRNTQFYLTLFASFLFISCEQSDIIFNTNDFLQKADITNVSTRATTINKEGKKLIKQSEDDIIIDTEIVNQMGQPVYIWEKPYGQETMFPFDEENPDKIYSTEMKANKIYRIRCDSPMNPDYGIGLYFKGISNISKAISSVPEDVVVFYDNLFGYYQWFIWIASPMSVWNTEDNANITFYFEDGSTVIFEVGNYEH